MEEPRSATPCLYEVRREVLSVSRDGCGGMRFEVGMARCLQKRANQIMEGKRARAVSLKRTHTILLLSKSLPLPLLQTRTQYLAPSRQTTTPVHACAQRFVPQVVPQRKPS